MPQSQQLSEFVAATNFQDLPPPVVDTARVLLLDNLAAGFAGASQPWTAMVGQMARDQAQDGACTVFGQPWRLPPSYAALVNGTAISAFEVDHAYVEGSAHPSAAVFPAVLAIAERDGASGASLLLAMALGYEVLCRVGRAATRAVEDIRGFHGPGTNAAFGAAAGVSKLLGLPATEVNHALGIAGSHGAGLLEFAREGAMTKRLHVGRGSQMGLESALLAARGFTGPTAVLEGEHGFLRVYSPSPRPELLTEGLGTTWVFRDTTVKAYPCHISFHAVIEGIMRLRREHGVDAKGVERVKVAGGPWMMERRHADRAPATVLGGQYSLPFSLAVALARGMDDPAVFDPGVLADPVVRELARTVELEADGTRFVRNPGMPAAEITLTRAGHTHTLVVTDWKGAPSDPCTFADISDKFRRYAGGAATRAQIEEIVASVARLEEVRDVRPLAALLAGARQA
ncbi:MAG: MmgE/PrpD family protein [Dehalococcoidia bacterium]|nr:MmgE/PrpD family protein [Dehalococcoidia bacterium]